jgi:hypothetical protein
VKFKLICQNIPTTREEDKFLKSIMWGGVLSCLLIYLIFKQKTKRLENMWTRGQSGGCQAKGNRISIAYHPFNFFHVKDKK